MSTIYVQPQVAPRPKKLLDQVREKIRLKHYSRRTEETYVDWIRQYVFPSKKHSVDPRSGIVQRYHRAWRESLVALLRTS